MLYTQLKKHVNLRFNITYVERMIHKLSRERLGGELM